MAEAHETYWSVAMEDTSGGYSSVGIDRRGAPEHRRKALELYEQYLKLRPNAPERRAIRRRLRLIRANVDTGFQKYLCLSDC